MKSSGWCFDIRSSSSHSTACFTKSYTRYIKGTGSVLLVLPENNHNNSSEIILQGDNNQASNNDCFQQSDSCNEEVSMDNIENNPEEREFNQDWWKELLTQHNLEPTEYTGTDNSVRLRFFSPKELTRLFGFSEDFHFPSSVPLRKQYELIGNSLNVKVASELLRYLLRCTDKSCSNYDIS